MSVMVAMTVQGKAPENQDKIKATLVFLKNQLDEVDKLASNLFFLIENIDHINIHHKDEAKEYLVWLRMKIIHLYEEGHFELTKLRRRLEKANTQ